MSNIYMKALMSAIIVSMVIFIIPDAFAQTTPVDCLIIDQTSTTNSITVEWIIDPITCVIPDDVTLESMLTLELGSDSIEVEVTGYSYTFSNLDSGTNYSLTISVSYVDEDEELVFVDSIIVSIQTETEPEEEVITDCVDFDEAYLTLSATYDTITLDFSDETICGVSSDSTLYNFVTLSNTTTTPAIFDAISGDSFSNLLPDTQYTVQVDVFLDINSGTMVGSIEKTTTTLSESIIFEPTDVVEETEAEIDESNGSGCSGDCTPPTIGLDEDNKRLVDNGFSYNNNPVDVIAWHTPYPLITAIVNQTNTVEIIVYDNQGIFYLDMVQFGLGVKEFGQPLHEIEVLIEVHLETLYSENTVIVEKVVIRDRDNLIDTYSVFAVTDVVDCIDDEIDEKCLKVTLQYSYRESTINNMMAVNVIDKARNSQNFYLNDGVEVIGESMNEPPTYKIFNQKSNQQTENLWLNLVRTDKVNHIWMDENGIEYLKVSEDRYDRITPAEPHTCNDPPLSEINVPTRNNCHFRALVSFWN